MFIHYIEYSMCLSGKMMINCLIVGCPVFTHLCFFKIIVWWVFFLFLFEQGFVSIPALVCFLFYESQWFPQRNHLQMVDFYFILL